MRETWVRSLGWEDPLEKEMETHSSILAWRIPRTEEPGGLQSTGSQRVRHNWVTSLHFTSIIYSIPETRKKERQRGKRSRNTAVTWRRNRQNKKSSALTLLAKKQTDKKPRGRPTQHKRRQGHTDGIVEECLIHHIMVCTSFQTMPQTPRSLTVN